jgi:predicted nucleic acid-binding protein
VQGVATQTADDLVLATAVSAGADYLVTRDGKLLQVGSYQGVNIASPTEFLQHLANDTGGRDTR